jgi:hypothetical protein
MPKPIIRKILVYACNSDSDILTLMLVCKSLHSIVDTHLFRHYRWLDTIFCRQPYSQEFRREYYKPYDMLNVLVVELDLKKCWGLLAMVSMVKWMGSTQMLDTQDIVGNVGY